MFPEIKQGDDNEKCSDMNEIMITGVLWWEDICVPGYLYSVQDKISESISHRAANEIQKKGKIVYESCYRNNKQVMTDL